MKTVFAALAASVVTTSAVADLVDGSFESYPADSYSYFDGGDPHYGWATTALDNTLEIWSSWTEGVEAYHGNNFAELNATYASTLYQDVGGLGDNNSINWHFAHRGRWGVDTMRLTITDLGADQQWGGGDDFTLFTQEFSAGTGQWEVNYGSVISIGNTTRFAFEAVSAAGGPTIGNLIDWCGFGANEVPAPGAISLLAIGGLIGTTRRRR
jgi:hypothetical protein